LHRRGYGATAVVHVGTLVFVPLLAGVVFLLLGGVVGVAALVSRSALAVFAVFTPCSRS
jgi:hypothetical protein